MCLLIRKTDVKMLMFRSWEDGSYYFHILSFRCNVIKAKVGYRLSGLKKELHVWRAVQKD